MANSVDPDQARSSLIWVYTVCPGLPVQKLRIIMVGFKLYCFQSSNYFTRKIGKHSFVTDGIIILHTDNQVLCTYALIKDFCAYAIKTYGINVKSSNPASKDVFGLTVTVFRWRKVRVVLSRAAMKYSVKPLCQTKQKTVKSFTHGFRISQVIHKWVSYFTSDSQMGFIFHKSFTNGFRISQVIHKWVSYFTSHSHMGFVFHKSFTHGFRISQVIHTWVSYFTSHSQMGFVFHKSFTHGFRISQVIHAWVSYFISHSQTVSYVTSHSYMGFVFHKSFTHGFLISQVIHKRVSYFTSHSQMGFVFHKSFTNGFRISQVIHKWVSYFTSHSHMGFLFHKSFTHGFLISQADGFASTLLG